MMAAVSRICCWTLMFYVEAILYPNVCFLASDYGISQVYSIFVPRLFEEKRKDIVFGFPSFRLSVPLKYYVPCVRNSSYSFMPILSKLYICFCHGLKICMWFGYYPEIIFCHFFRNLNLVIFRRFYYQSE